MMRRRADLHGQEVAVIGLSLHFPGADGPEEFWANLREGIESVERLDAEQVAARGVPRRLSDDPRYVKISVSMREPEAFDARFFGYSPREARLIDPQQRVFLETCWEALEAAGYAPEACVGPVGVYAGTGMNWYLEQATHKRSLGEYSGFEKLIAGDKDFLPTRVAYHLNLQGPAVNVQTACSTGLVAVHVACQGLLSGDCDLALAGASAVSPYNLCGYLHQPGMIHAPDGHCRPFDAGASGTMFGNGVAAVVLKRLADAERDDDHILAVIKGTAVNNDGARKVGYTAPSVSGQAEVIEAALRAAGLDARTISYVEAHGTATELGDPIEVAALTQAFRRFTTERAFCGLGSVKSNFGHLDTVAGLAGLIKAILALQHGELPPTLHYARSNPHIDFEASPFRVIARREPWRPEEVTRRAGVSSFGIGGTNAHVVLEEAPPRRPPLGSQGPHHLLVCSARSRSALTRQVEALIAQLGRHPDSLADTAFTLAVGRQPLAHRRAAVVQSSAAGIAALRAEHFLPLEGSARLDGPRPVAFLLPGQGSQYLGMARELYAGEAAFRTRLDDCARILRPHLERDLLEVMFGSDPDLLNRTDMAQSALFSVEYALCMLLADWGIAPTAIIGHSVGEYVAACLAGVMAPDQALRLVAVRGRLMASRPAGSMLAVSASPEELSEGERAGLCLAAVNAPGSCVLSGPSAVVDSCAQALAARGVATRRLQTSHAFHSSMMDPILPAFRQEVEKVALSPPTVPFVSNVTGDWITPEMATDPGYWTRHLRATVLYAASLERVGSRPILLEVGPGTALSSLARQNPVARQAAVVALLPPPREGRLAEQDVLRGLGRLWTAGGEVDWARFYAGRQGRRVPLPTYPFERQTLTIQNHGPETPSSGAGTNLYVPGWQRSPRPSVSSPSRSPQTWLALIHDTCFARQVVDALSERGELVVTVSPGEAFQRSGDLRYVLDPETGANYSRLLGELASVGLAPERVLYGWTLGEGKLDQTDEPLDFIRLVRLAQALTARTADLLVLSDGLQDVAGEPLTAPVRAAVLGLSAALPHELPLATRQLDVQLPADSGQRQRLLDDVVAECLLPSPASGVVAYRGGYRWTRNYVPLPVEPSGDGSTLRPGGVYLITGGLGGIGLALGLHLARRVGARLVLTSRGEVPRADTSERARRIQAGLEQIRAAGGEALALQADVADEEAMARALATARERFGALNGVIHAAGLAENVALTEDSEASGRRQLRPKFEGARVLERCLSGTDLDFVVYFSSLAAQVGGYGLGGYAAANACLDALAEATSQPRTISINWGAWSEVGRLASDVKRSAPTGSPYQETVEDLLRERLEEEMRAYALSTEEGLRAFDQILATPARRVLVTRADLTAQLTRQQAGPRPQARPQAETGADFRSELSAPYQAPGTDTERTVAKLWEHLLGVEPIGIHDDFFELGGHSLLAAQLLARLYERLSLKLSMRSLFEARTVAEMATLIEHLRWAADEGQPAAPGEDREEIVI